MRRPAIRGAADSAWPNIVAALRYVGTYVMPRIGPVEVVSVYRNAGLNACAGGAPESTHRYMGAVDMVPLRPISREALMTQLCVIHRRSGERNFAGLGFYKGLRFHIDARKFREWGTAGARGGLRVRRGAGGGGDAVQPARCCPRQPRSSFRFPSIRWPRSLKALCCAANTPHGLETKG